MDMDAEQVCLIVADSSRFADPFSDPCSYYIWTDQESVESKWISIYWDKLAYAVRHADDLIAQVFHEICKYDEIKRNIGGISEDMCQKLRFESFVLIPDREEVGCCLSSPEVMTGHFIDCYWNLDWHLLCFYYC